MSPTDGMIPRCKNSSQLEEPVRPFRCLHANSKRENIVSPAMDCNISRIYKNDECRPGDKWQQTASVECTKQGMVLDSSIMTLDWCDLDAFRGAEFVCCPLRGRKARFVLPCSMAVPSDTEDKTGNDADYQISFDEQDDDVDETLTEDDPIRELVVVPKVKSLDSPRKLLAESHSRSGKTSVTIQLDHSKTCLLQSNRHGSKILVNGTQTQVTLPVSHREAISRAPHFIFHRRRRGHRR